MINKIRLLDWLYCNVLNNFRQLPKRPDFTMEEIDFLDAITVNDDGTESAGVMVYFANHPPFIAVRNGWVRCYGEYWLLADNEFARRFPEHGYSLIVKESGKHDDLYIEAWAKFGWHSIEAKKASKKYLQERAKNK